MNIEGYAYTKRQDEIAAERWHRYSEIQQFEGELQLRKDPVYGQVRFFGVLTDETRHLSEYDLGLIADRGSMCFGGDCTKTGDTFSGCYFTD